MAQEIRHAAWQNERSFAVRLLPEDGPPADLGSGLTEFLDAFDLASEWISREDPARDGTASLAIVETRDGVSEQIWTYTPGQPPADVRPLTWAGVPEFSTRERRSRLRQRMSADANGVTRVARVASSPARPVASPEPEIEKTEVVAARETPRQWIHARVRSAWDDRLSRCCLIACGASLWFSVGLVDAHFLLPLLVFSPVLWWRQRRRDPSPHEAETEDWL